TDAPFLVEITDGRPGRYLRANRLSEDAEEENGDCKLLLWDEEKGPRMPGGTLGFRWQKEKGKWNLKLEDPRTGEPLNPRLSLLGA
ncbi:UNVERIFIED_CONTAM: hypothetical protein IGO34_32745, partial [Salmonella enterica subsp. enterica serovar Weltevreden]